MIASDRVPFFQDVYGNSAAEASAQACHQLGDVVVQIDEEGDHIEVCAACMLLRADAFSRALPAFLEDDDMISDGDE